MRESLKQQLRGCGISTSDILLPKKNVDYYKWAVVACDQFTSQKDYWNDVDVITSDVPSTSKLIFPECYLEDDDKQQRIKNINETMDNYIKIGVFDCYPDSFILVERTTVSGTRYGLVASLDLEKYSYAEGSRSLIRATEGTILSRIPPRKEIRKHASLELPHIMVLINDARRLVIEPLVARRAELECIYDTDLMKGGGHVKGYLVNRDEDIKTVADGISMLYKTLDQTNPLLYAMGDGNHSLATAKSIYEDLKREKGKEALDSPCRYALVEIENIFDPALQFEAIHRVFFNIKLPAFDSLLSRKGGSITKDRVSSLKEAADEIEKNSGCLKFAVICGNDCYVYRMKKAKHALSASLIQECIDNLPEGSSVDYIHGAEVTEEIAKKEGNIGIILPDISKETFFDAIIRDGAFPRKTFSIGHAEEKRYYMEARSIRQD